MTSPLLEVVEISKYYSVRQRFGKTSKKLALEPLSFTLNAGETLAIMGETGSGKSTIAKIVAGVERPSSGQLLLRGEVLDAKNYRQRCSHIRMIFQDSLRSLNRQLSIGQQLHEPLRFNTQLSWSEQQRKVTATLKQVGLLPEHYHFYPDMLSSGQQQRVCIARAIILEPQIIVADEAFVALDPSIRAQIINLILDLQQDMGISFIFISHSAEIVKHVADKILIMHHGKLVEFGSTEELLARPQHPLTQGLLAAEQR